MGRYTWFKIYADRWLRGKLRQETPATRGIFGDLLALAADTPYCPEIKASEQVGFTDEQFCDMLCLKPEEWILAKQRLKILGSIVVRDNNTIVIKNWQKYQSKYDRLKPYQQKYQKKLKTIGHVSLQEYFSATIASLAKHSSEDVIYEALTNLPPSWHESLHSALTRLYPGGSSYVKAKRRYEEQREIHGLK